ncbi:hypothetical protein HPP92_028774 [Vanilla planifolia]|uniref:Uncharacterized protein n=1 Tax=Vanilla planifolia TaxID=51239 RepID=A0A835P6F0_VANPL|nr:hypothetical protein HPP92_028774 [Vanilla planifolia]KAG0446584.1 hypothetical protein HPP92_028763 [Vanilla planifolia]
MEAGIQSPLADFGALCNCWLSLLLEMVLFRQPLRLFLSWAFFLAPLLASWLSIDPIGFGTSSGLLILDPL